MHPQQHSPGYPLDPGRNLAQACGLCRPPNASRSRGTPLAIYSGDTWSVCTTIAGSLPASSIPMCKAS